jgi:hypothetical protein
VRAAVENRFHLCSTDNDNKTIACLFFPQKVAAFAGRSVRAAERTINVLRNAAFLITGRELAEKSRAPVADLPIEIKVLGASRCFAAATLVRRVRTLVAVFRAIRQQVAPQLFVNFEPFQRAGGEVRLHERGEHAVLALRLWKQALKLGRFIHKAD